MHGQARSRNNRSASGSWAADEPGIGGPGWPYSGPCLRRVRRLEAEGVITGYTALVNPAALGRDFEVIIYADLVAKDLATVASFEERLVAMDEVAELRRMFGIPDYFIRVQTADLAAYEQWLSVKLMGDPAIARVDSRLTMKLLKSRR